MLNQTNKTVIHQRCFKYRAGYTNTAFPNLQVCWNRPGKKPQQQDRFSPASCKSVWWKWRTRIRPGVNHAGRKVIMCMSTTHNVTSFYSVSRSCWTKGRLDFVIWFQSLPFREVEHLLSSGLCNQPCNIWVLTLLSPSSLTQFRIKVWW